MPRITLAAPYTDADGKQHKADSTVTVDAGEASRLKHYGLGRDPEPAKEKSPTKAPERVDTKKES